MYHSQKILTGPSLFSSKFGLFASGPPSPSGKSLLTPVPESLHWDRLFYYNMNNTIFLISSYINSVSRSRLVTLLLFSRPLDPFFLQKHLKILICIYRINLIICKLLLFDIKFKNYYYHFSHLALSASAEKVLKDANKFLTRSVLDFYGEFFIH